MLGQPNSVIRLVKDVAVAIHNAAIDFEHDRLPMTASNLESGCCVRGKMNMMAATLDQPILQDRVKKAPGSSVV